MSVQVGPVSRRRWLRTSLRGLIVLVIVTVAGLGWIVRTGRIQRESVAAINQVDGGVSYDRATRNGRPNPIARP
jgi:hypothetical protein